MGVSMKRQGAKEYPTYLLKCQLKLHS